MGFFKFYFNKRNNADGAGLATQADISSRQLFFLSPFHQVQRWESRFLPKPSYSHPTTASPSAGCLVSALLFSISKSPGGYLPRCRDSSPSLWAFCFCQGGCLSIPPQAMGGSLLAVPRLQEEVLEMMQTVFVKIFLEE